MIHEHGLKGSDVDLGWNPCAAICRAFSCHMNIVHKDIELGQFTWDILCTYKILMTFEILLFYRDKLVSELNL